jgi:hypothetical protein
MGFERLGSTTLVPLEPATGVVLVGAAVKKLRLVFMVFPSSV